MDSPPPARPERNLIDVLAALSRGATRYDREAEVARGGMGAIHRVWDRDLRRQLAMKVFLGDAEVPQEASRDAHVDARVARFVEEAQITGQLDHPGIVPVHELGLDAQGRLYFTMRLVQGHTLAEAFELARAGAEGWSATRVLRTLVRVCEAVAYAHSRGVVHRDLKPANIMVGPFGEVYVMDWGLAKVLGAEERAGPSGAAPSVQSDRSEEASVAPQSPLLTMEGSVLGTPAYMPPEQARGRHQDVGPRSDVYALGAILYEFLTGRMPYASEGQATSAHAILRSLLEGPPRPVSELRPEAPAELVAVCERAMARDPQQRFADSLEMAEALGRFFERPVTQARRGLQRSRLVTAIQWILGFMFWALCLALVLIGVIVWTSMGDSAFSLSLPISFELADPGYQISSRQSWVADVELLNLNGYLVLQSTHWLAKLAFSVTATATILFLMFVIRQARQILRTVRQGEPFALENMRRMRRIGAAFLVLGILQAAQRPLMGYFAENYLETSGIVLRGTLELPYLQFLGGAVILILAEVFRVGAELEKRAD